MAEPGDSGVEAFVSAVEREFKGDGAVLTDRDLERVMTAAVRLYAMRSEESGQFPPPLARESVSATEVVTVVSEMIRVVDINLFDLSMWYRRPRG